MTSALPPSLLDPLTQRRLVIVTGKGGVGKTVVSAALGRVLSSRGRRTLIVEVDPRENVHQMLGVPPSGGEIVGAGRDLWVQNLKPRQVLDEIVREQVKIDLIARRVLASSIYEHFSAGAPGLKELAILGHAFRLLRRVGSSKSPNLDTIVLDAPATGHGVSLLAAPALVAEVITNGPFSKMATELARFIAEPEEVGIVVVTQAEEMPVEESLELRTALREKVGRDPELLVVNGLFPEVPSDEPGGAGGPLLDLWRRRRALQERELAELVESWAGPRIDLPQIPLDRGPALAAALERCLNEGSDLAGSAA